MKILKLHTITILILLFSFSLYGRNIKDKSNNNNQSSSFLFNCQKPISQIDLDINNVRARLTTGGDMWWDRSDGAYIVPKPAEGEQGVSSIFAAATWIGGRQDNNFRIAAQTYGNGGANTRDFWSGPLNEVGLTDPETCANWDRFWEVTRAEIESHLQLCGDAGQSYDPADIPDQIKSWPAQGNPYFEEMNGFSLPATSTGLAPFFDQNGDGQYNPQEGDYPVAEIDGCNAPIVPDQMFFWIYNDNGNIHTESNGDAIRIEIQAQSFAYATNDVLNNTTFQKYKLVNHAPARIDDAYFGLWMDVDLGCHEDDWIGCDTTRNMAYYYNQDALDGSYWGGCSGGKPTYGDDIPALGIDFLRTPRRTIFDSNGQPIDAYEEVGMSSFTYYTNTGDPPTAITGPSTVTQHYYYLTGRWRDGSPFTYGGDGLGGTEVMKYAFPSPPDDPDGWSMCSSIESNSSEYNRLTIQSAGPFTLLPGQVDEVAIGVVWMPSFDYPCPDLSRLFIADDQVQDFFGSCLDFFYPIEAPDIDIIELEQELVLTLSNDEVSSNNAFEMYEDYNAYFFNINYFPELDGRHKFQGYQIFQLKSPEDYLDLGDPTKARLVAQCDIEDEVTNITNWDLSGEFPEPTLMVEGANEGINHTFVITHDAFAPEDDNALINHKKYYYTAIAYAHNNWQDYDPITFEGQPKPYLSSRINRRSYTAIPRPITDVNLNVSSGNSPKITCYDGVGVGGNFVEISEETKAEILATAFDKNQSFNAPITYKEGQGPISIKIYNPLEVKNGEYKIELLDENYTENGELTTWELSSTSHGTITYSDVTIEQLNEQLIADFGFSITVNQEEEPGNQTSFSNGAIGVEEEYFNPDATPWYRGIENKGGEVYEGTSLAFQNILSWANEEEIMNYDSNEKLVGIGSGFLPYQLTNPRSSDLGQAGFISPAWVSALSAGAMDLPQKLGELNNVDIVFTSNKDLWSECVIVETANPYYDSHGFSNQGDISHFTPRNSPSVSKDAGTDGLPLIDNNATRPTGMGWFPGYAIDVETGQRLNIFFGENSAYNCENFEDCSIFENGIPKGADMMYNPDSQIYLNIGNSLNAVNFYLGGQHFIYVTNQTYDGCEEIHDLLLGDITERTAALQKITWTGVGIASEDAPLNSYEEGLIPSELNIKIRVDNPYQKEERTEIETGENPTYGFTIEGKEETILVEKESQLDKVNVVPNPYYAVSDYEANFEDRIVKITNLPAECTVTIYTLDGKFIRQFDRNEMEGEPYGSGILESQIIPDIEWDLKTNTGTLIAGGVYLIHIQSDELGERVLKWFGRNRS